MDDSKLKKLQDVELDILVIFDKFCQDHDICYSLFAGTALGAVRHKGFIPWDDDVDVFMDVKNYDRLISTWHENPVEGYYLQATDDKNSHINHTKIRKDGTVLASQNEMKTNEHHGIWIDIFPFYKVPVEEHKRKKFNRNAQIRILFTRDHIPEKANIFVKVAALISHLTPSRIKEMIRTSVEKKLRQYDDLTSGFEYEDISAAIWMNKYYPSTMFDGYTNISFNNKNFQIVAEYKKMLEIKYGDYMQLPPKEEQVCRHNPEVIDCGDDK